MSSDFLNRVRRAQEFLAVRQLDGWLLHDFQGNNPILWQLLGGQKHTTRRLAVLTPAEGEPELLVSLVDGGHFRDFAGQVRGYRQADQYRAALAEMLGSQRTIAMEYSAGAALPVREAGRAKRGRVRGRLKAGRLASGLKAGCALAITKSV